MPNDVPPQVLHLGGVPKSRRKTLSPAKFWALMERWGVTRERALDLIGEESWNDAGEFSDEQAKVLSCLLEIDLTLIATGRRERCLHKRSRKAPMDGSSPIDAMGRCDPGRAARVLWSLSYPSRLQG